jgi:hypothetical protein
LYFIFYFDALCACPASTHRDLDYSPVAIADHAIGADDKTQHYWTLCVATFIK